MKLKKLGLVISIFLLFTAQLFSQVIVKAEINSDEYEVSDIVKVLISVQNNPGLHTLFFDLEYDESILSFEGKRDSRIFRDTENSSEILYAQNTLSQGFDTCRMVVSYTLKGKETEIESEGTLVELSFRIIGTSVENHSFVFSNCKLIDGDENEITDVTWQNSREFTILEQEVTEFILIRKPYENEVFYINTVSLSLICTEGEDYLVTITNSEKPDDPLEYIEVEDGRLLNQEVEIVDGINKITARLYTADQSGGTDHEFKTMDTVRVYKSPETDFVKIIDPDDHSLLNTDMVTVRALSPFNYVEINGRMANFYGETQDDAKVFESTVWLKSGFNTMTAIAHKDNIEYESILEYGTDQWAQDPNASWTSFEFVGMYLEIDGKFATITNNSDEVLNMDTETNEIGPIGGGPGGAGTPYRIRSTREIGETINYKDSIQVYYQKDSSIFNFIKPYADQCFKPSEYNRLEILGEIDSEYKTTDDPVTGGPVKNTVSLKVVYYPANLAKNPIILADRNSVIIESDYGYGMSRSKYVFKNDFDIPLDDLEKGEIEIIAYKNKIGNTWNDKITRIVYIDDQRLRIDLVQPNVYTSDVLDTKSKLQKFNESQEITSTPEESILITNQGKICLNTIEPVVYKENIGDVDQIVESPDGTLYAMVNPSNSSMEIYKKSPGEKDWTVVISQTGIYGYSLCYSKIGLLTGVSNIPSTGNSGLYMVNDNELVEFEFSEVSLPHVQFISSIGNRIYLYGSLFNSLYSFDIFNIEENNGKYRVLGLREEFFPNNYSIVQFILSDDGQTAMIRTDETTDNIHFYKNSTHGFFETTLPELNGSSEFTGEVVIHGPYENSDYESYLVFRSGAEAEMVMHNISTGRFFRREINFKTIFGVAEPITVMGAGFRNSEYTFICKYLGNYYLSAGEFYFDNYYGESGANARLFDTTETIGNIAEGLFITQNDNYYLGINSLGSDELYNFYNSFADNGSVDFNYVNDDVDRLLGFSFELNPLWQETDNDGLEYIPEIITFGFSVKEKEAGADTAETDEVSFELPPKDISDLIKMVDVAENKKYISPDENYTIYRSYNSYTGRELLYFEFVENRMPENCYLHFNFEISALGTTSAGIHSLEVFKKIIAKIAGSPGDTIYLPIQGYVHDSTVTQIKIGSTKVTLGRDRSFHDVKAIDSTVSSATIYLSCKNVTGEEAVLNFTVEIIESENEIWDLFCNYAGELQKLVPDPETENFNFNTESMEITVSGEYFGLAGAVCGYETYSISDTGFTSPVNRGVFITTIDASVYTGPDLGTGYEAGYFPDQAVKLVPNNQVLVIYVENPGGIRYEYTSEDGTYPVFNYQMPEEDQMVVFDADYEITETIDDIQYTHKKEVYATESPAPYCFTVNAEIEGEVRTIEQLDEVRVISVTPGIVFENGEQEITAPLGAGNKFSVPFSVTMGDDEIEKDFYIVVRPTIPVYSFMRRGIVVTVKKDFSRTYFVPDFSETKPENTKTMQIRFAFKDRTDIPLDKSIEATFIVNYSHENITGYVDELGDYYCLRDIETDEILNLENLKIGTNRIQWTLQFLDRDKETGEVKHTILMSSSSFAGMDDVIFTITDDTPVTETTVTFSDPLENTYYSLINPVPSLLITKDPDTTCSLYLNSILLHELTDEENPINYALPTASIKEGRNSLVIYSTDKNNSEEVFSYTFLYDSKPPEVGFYSWDVTGDYAVLKELTVIVTEANYNRGYLHYGDSIINAEPGVTILGEDTYLLSWENLDDPIDYNIRPGTGTEAVTVSVLDLAGTSGVTGNLEAFMDMQRPDEETIQEREIELPPYNAAIDEQTGTAPAGSTDPVPYNEINYINRPFRDHTKFAPRLLTGQVDVKDEIDEEGWLVRNHKVQKVIPEEGVSDYDMFREDFGWAASVSGDVAVIGAPYDDDAGTDAGMAYIYQWNGSEWVYKDKLTPEPGDDADCNYDNFGYSVSVSGYIIVVGARGDDDAGTDAGAAYIYRLDGSEWTNEDKLIPEPGTDADYTGDHFGFSVSISGDIIVVGATDDDDAENNAGAVYIYRLDGSEWVYKDKLIPEPGDDADCINVNFGYSVSVSGDIIVVGALSDNDAGSNAGAAYIYRWNGSEWTNEDKLIPEPGDDADCINDSFGFSVSVTGNIIVVGAWYDDDTGEDAGAAYIYRWNGSEWTNEDKLIPEPGDDADCINDNFGISVSVSVDIIVVGAWCDNDAGSNAGAAYIYRWNGLEWTNEDKLIPEPGTDADYTGDRFGKSVSISGDIIVVGAIGDDDDRYEAGAAYIYSDLNNLTPDTLDTSFPFGSHEKSYLVFQIEKRANPDIYEKTHIEGLIDFEVSGLMQDLAISHDVIPVYPETAPNLISGTYFLNMESHSRYIEGLQYLYYIVDIDDLKSEFETATETMWTGISTQVPVDRGRLKIVYSYPLDDYPPYRVYVTETQDDAIEDIIVFDKAYESEQPDGDHVLAHEMFRHSPDDLTVPLTEETDELSLSFWLRVEDEGITDEGFNNTDKRIVTFTDDMEDELYYLCYEKEENEILIDFVDSTGGGSVSWLIGDGVFFPLIVENAAGVRNDSWNHIVLRFTKDDTSGYVNISVNDCELFNEEIDIALNFYNRIIAPGAGFYFGPDFSNGNEAKDAGFYSLAHPFYINRWLTEDEIKRLVKFYNFTTGGTSEYFFNNAESEIGSGENSLRIICNTDYPAPDYNAGYDIPEDAQAFCEAFKASSSIPNYFTITSVPDPGSGNYVILKNADSSVQHNVDVTGEQESFTIELDETADIGRYYFGNKNNNYGLKPNRWYSISGEVISVEPGIEARLVMKLNGSEQSMLLKEGEFHFIYDNPSEETPADVKVYIETTGDIEINNNKLTFNEGNFIVPPGINNKGYSLSAASTTFTFDYSGTVDLWYKPFITNSQGFINYDVVLFDSEFIKIEAAGSGYSESEFKATIKKEDSTDNIELVSSIKADYDWHHLQVSYNHASQVVYFYLDGKVVDIYEGTELPESATIQGDITHLNEHGDNVFIGCNEDQSVFAQGYLDNVRISKYFYYSRYKNITPIEIYHIIDEENSDDNCLAMDTIDFTEDDITDDSYTLIATDGTYINNNNVDLLAEPFNTSGLPAGRYQLISEMKINGKMYHNYLTFNVDNKPRFNLVDKTPLIFSNVETPVYFAFEYDNSYIYETDQLKYAGVAIRINGNREAYIVQDFISQDASNWLQGSTDGGVGVSWTPLEKDNGGRLIVTFPQTTATDSILCEYEYFYFTETLNTQEINTFGDGDPEDDTIVLASLTDVAIKYKTYEIDDETKEDLEYMLYVEVAGDSSSSSDIYEDIVIEYTIEKSDDSQVTSSGTYLLKKKEGGNFYVDMYYDDILPDYGKYDCTVELKYNDNKYADAFKTLYWKQLVTTQVETEKSLEIDEFSLLELNKEDNKASFYLQIYNNNINSMSGKLEIKQGFDVYTHSIGDIPTMSSTWSDFIDNVDIPEGYFTVTVKIEAPEDGFLRSREMELSNFKSAPDIVLTNWVESVISYNDVYFSWKGYLEGKFDENIEYCYNFDDSGFSSWSGEWRDVRFYNLCEGYHSFEVKARNPDGNAESVPEQVTFFVDINRPVFDPGLISVENLYDSLNILSGVTIRGNEGAINDASLRYITIDSGQEVIQGENGAFKVSDIPITKDGITEVTITAIDRVGNYTDYTVNVENYITEIVFPDISEYVKYSPLTIVGNIDANITAGVDIYLCDPFCAQDSNSNYDGWKKGKVNQDRTFFVENVFVNPGTADQGIVTTLRLASVFENGKVFEREIEIWANEIILPIELILSQHSAEGENADTEVTITAYANVENISSWSIDFDGDGIYDSIDLVENPEDESSKIMPWEHTYSSIGLVHPRVRVITTDGNFFSVSDTLIIHEKIKEVSHKMIDMPISMDSKHMDDDSERIFLLKGLSENTTIDVFEVGRNESYISNKLYTINLSALGIDGPETVDDLGSLGPVCIRVIDKDHLLVGVNTDTTGIIYELAANEFGNYEIVLNAELTGLLNDITLDKYKVYVSYLNRNYVTTIALEEKLINLTSIEDSIPDLYNTQAIGENTGLAKDSMGLLVADFYNQRIIRLTNDLRMHEQFGTIGTGEKEFLTPSIIKSFENRIFVFDQTRCDIQVFDLTYTPVCTLAYKEDHDYNYMENTFFNDIADITIMSRIENNMLYYYALIVSKSSNKLALLRLPQWEEPRARVRNNKIVFIKDGEVFTAKPDGSDLRRILCTDSLPRVEGALNYPSLSPDGKKLVFTSRLDLYIGAFDEIHNVGNEYAYDHIYLYNIEEKTLARLYLGDKEGYEIERPVFNSNGDTLIFSAKETGSRWQIYTYSVDSGTTEQMFSSDENARFPYYSPEDDYIVFTTDYDGDEDIVIIGVDNPDIRIDVTNNNERDTFPVWISTYPEEEDSADYVDSKIAYVSEHLNFQKGIYYVFIQHIPDFGLNLVDSAGLNVGNDPDSAAIPITDNTEEGDYPCFTGDGKNIVFEQFNGEEQKLRNYDFPANPGSDEKITDMNLPKGSERPAGMKNMITNFKAENTAGNQVKLTWDRYTDKDIYYVLEIDDENDSQDSMNRDVLGQEGTLITGLKTGTDYRFRVYISENNEEVATSRVEYISIPVVTAIPTYDIDEENPYVIHFHAWKPSDSNGDTWRFSWIINNTEILVQNSQNFSFEYSTSGRKTIQLKVYDSMDPNDANNYDLSEPFYVDIISDIESVIEYVLAEDSRYVDLTCVNSLGYNIDFAPATWSITGPDGSPFQLTGPAVTADISGFSRKINVNLTLPRIPVSGQQGTDTIVKTKVIDLDYTDLKPIITYQENESKERLIKFSGQESIGNIDWYRARWGIFADNSIIYQTEGVSTFEYLFPERNSETIYSVSLTIPRRNDGITNTISQIISIEATPIEPAIDYEILSMTRDDDVIGQKIIFDCTKSIGSGIEFSQARWSVPIAGDYGNPAIQIGPTAIYNLVGIEQGIAIEVALTLTRAGGTDAKTVSQLINIKSGDIPAKKLVVNENIEDSIDGEVLVLDVLNSTGPNIDWENTGWVIDGQYTRKGPIVRYDVSASAEGTIINYTCVLYRHGGEPETATGQVTLGKTSITPRITPIRISPNQQHVYELSVLDTEGINIDWDKTRWYIYDGNQDVIIKQGAVITHAFALNSEQMGYPVLVEMFLKGNTKPFVGYKTIDVLGNQLVPIITYFREIDEEEDDPSKIMLSAETSEGSGIDWSQTKWTFLDTAEVAYGPVISHTFPRHSEGGDKTYTVALTLYRRQANGNVESKTKSQEIEIGSDEITPRIKAQVFDDYLVLSAEESTGYGLLLDRCAWAFPGEGDSVSYTDHKQEGTITKTNHYFNAKAGVSYTQSIDFLFLKGDLTVYAEGSRGGNTETTDYSAYEDEQNTFTTQNTHTGPICRRYIKDENDELLTGQIVTLMVYRMSTDGGVEGRSITVNIDLENVADSSSASADSQGVVYE